VTGADRDKLEARARKIIGDAVREADSQSNGWGTVPQEMKEEIRSLVSNQVPWRAVLKSFVGGLVRAGRSTSIRRINRKYPYVHPGMKRDHMPRLLIAIDQSGSMSDEAIGLIFAEIHSLSKKVEVGVVAFDCEVVDSSFELVRRGQSPKRNRVSHGGTDFSAPTRWANAPERRGKWDGLLIVTDGCAAPPEPSRIRRGWILIPGTDLAFGVGEEMVIKMSPDRDPKAARPV
jgi:predicted metal-dependent peptidase